MFSVLLINIYPQYKWKRPQITNMLEISTALPLVLRISWENTNLILKNMIYSKSYMKLSHYVKSVSIRSCSRPYFPAFGLNMGRYEVRHSDWIWRDTKYLFVFSPNAGKYGPEKLRIRTFYTQFRSWSLIAYHN